MTQLNHLQYAVLKTVWESPIPISAKNVGVTLNYSIENASQCVARPLKKLCAEGMINRTARNKRCVTYSPAPRRFPTVEIIAPAHTFGPKRKNTLLDVA